MAERDQARMPAPSLTHVCPTDLSSGSSNAKNHPDLAQNVTPAHLLNRGTAGGNGGYQEIDADFQKDYFDFSLTPSTSNPNQGDATPGTDTNFDINQFDPDFNTALMGPPSGMHHSFSPGIGGSAAGIGYLTSPGPSGGEMPLSPYHQSPGRYSPSAFSGISSASKRRRLIDESFDVEPASDSPRMTLQMTLMMLGEQSFDNAIDNVPILQARTRLQNDSELDLELMDVIRSVIEEKKLDKEISSRLPALWMCNLGLKALDTLEKDISDSQMQATHDHGQMVGRKRSFFDSMPDRSSEHDVSGSADTGSGQATDPIPSSSSVGSPLSVSGRTVQHRRLDIAKNQRTDESNGPQSCTQCTSSGTECQAYVIRRKKTEDIVYAKCKTCFDKRAPCSHVNGKRSQRYEGDESLIENWEMNVDPTKCRRVYYTLAEKDSAKSSGTPGSSSRDWKPPPSANEDSRASGDCSASKGEDSSVVQGTIDGGIGDLSSWDGSLRPRAKARSTYRG